MFRHRQMTVVMTLDHGLVEGRHSAFRSQATST